MEGWKYICDNRDEHGSGGGNFRSSPRPQRRGRVLVFVWQMGDTVCRRQSSGCVSVGLLVLTTSCIEDQMRLGPSTAIGGGEVYLGGPRGDGAGERMRPGGWSPSNGAFSGKSVSGDLCWVSGWRRASPTFEEKRSKVPAAFAPFSGGVFDSLLKAFVSWVMRALDRWLP